MPNNTIENKEDSYKRIRFNQFFKITWWTFNLVYNIFPLRTIVWLVATIILELESILYTYIFAKTVDALVNTAQQDNAVINSLYPYILILLLYSIFTLAVRLIKNTSHSYIRLKSPAEIRRKFYTKIHSLGIQTLEQPGVNDKITRADGNLGNVLYYLSGSITLVSKFINTITIGSLLFSILPWFAPLIILITIPYILYDKNMRMKIYKVDYENTEKRRIASNGAHNLSNISTLQEIIITNAISFLDDKYMSFQNWINNIFVKLQNKARVGTNILSLIAQILVLYGYFHVFKKLLFKTITVGNTLFWIRSLDMFKGSLESLSTTFNDQFESSIQLKDTYELFMTKPSFKDGLTDLQKLDKGPEIIFENVSFKYPNTERYVLKNLNLKIKSGEEIAIVGVNGAGKTTLVKLISRFYPVTEGNIYINGINILDIKSESLYKNMGVLFQDYNNYNFLTAEENIYIGKSYEPFDDFKMRVSVQTADAMDFINEYPNKFKQILDPRYKGGIKPSTGQWQKLAIARFLYRNAPLVIFDEPTASIDASSEYKIFNSIYDFFEKKTVIIISHRFSTVRNADRIIVLDNGDIVEDGTHKELMEKKGKYYESFSLQAKGYTD